METGAFAVLAVALAGCAATETSATARPPAPSPAATAGNAPPRGEGVPAWAMHVKPAPIDPRLPIDATISRLMSELREPGLKDGHLPAGQLAIAAVASLDAGHRADAALLLSIACYRYEQQYRHVTEVHLGGADPSSKLLVDVAIGAPDAMATLEQDLRTGPAHQPMTAARVARAVRDPSLREALLQLAPYEDARHYPEDVLVRHAAMLALLAIALQ